MLIILGLVFLAILATIYFFHKLSMVEFCEECLVHGWGMMLKGECRCNPNGKQT